MDTHGHSGHSEETVRRQIKAYIKVFVALMVLTIITVAISYLHLPVMVAVMLAMAVATVKGAMVASVFMHLSGEKKIIFYILVLTAFFAVFLLLMPSWHHY